MTAKRIFHAPTITDCLQMALDPNESFGESSAFDIIHPILCPSYSDTIFFCRPQKEQQEGKRVWDSLVGGRLIGGANLYSLFHVRFKI